MVRPDPIPNSAVKHSLADGSSLIDSARVGSRQSFKKAETKVSAFLLKDRAPRVQPVLYTRMASECIYWSFLFLAIPRARHDTYRTAPDLDAKILNSFFEKS